MYNPMGLGIDGRYFLGYVTYVDKCQIKVWFDNVLTSIGSEIPDIVSHNLETVMQGWYEWTAFHRIDLSLDIIRFGRLSTMSKLTAIEKGSWNGIRR